MVAYASEARAATFMAEISILDEEIATRGFMIEGQQMERDRHLRDSDPRLHQSSLADLQALVGARSRGTFLRAMCCL